MKKEITSRRFILYYPWGLLRITLNNQRDEEENEETPWTVTVKKEK